MSPARVDALERLEQPVDFAARYDRSGVGHRQHGRRVRVRVDGTLAITAEVTPAAVDALNLDAGGQLWASVPPTSIHPYPP